MIFPKSFFLTVICACAFSAQDECIRTVEQLENSFNTNQNNVNEVAKILCPTNEEGPDVVLVHYCVLDENSTCIKNGTCNDTATDFTFQWLDTAIPLAIDYVVFTALTYNFANLKVSTAYFVVGSFCADLPPEFDEVYLLGSLTSGLKLNAKSECKNQKKGYALYLKGEGKVVADKKETRLKYIIGIWLFVAAITFAGILHCGRCCNSVAKRLEKMIEDSAALFMAVVDLFRIFGKLNKLFKSLKTLLSDKNSKTDEKDKNEKHKKKAKENCGDKGKQAKRTDKVKTSESTDQYEENETSETAPFVSLEVDEPNEQTSDNLGSTLNANSSSGSNPFPFLKWFEQNQKFYPLCVVYFIGFVVLDLIFIIKMGNTFSNIWDYLLHSPIPIWLIAALSFNTFAFVTVMICFEKYKLFWCLTSPTAYMNCIWDYVVVMTVTTLPLFLFFHGFWLFIAAVAYPARVAASAAFYTPLLSVLILYTVTFGSTISICCKYCQGSDNDDINLKTFCSSLTPIVFAPFWALFLASLYTVSDFTLRFGGVSKHPWTVILVALAVIASAHKLAKLCVTKQLVSEKAPSD